MNIPNTVAKLRTSFAPGLVVFLVALPLCLGIALASGAPPIAGIISGVIGGIVVGFLSNSNISVTGPAAGLSAIVLNAITDLGSYELFLCAGIIAGFCQLILGFLKSGSIASFFPSNVIEGMLAGIGVIIIIKQLPLVFGVQTISQLLPNPGVWSALGQNIHWGSVLITLISAAILIFWDRSQRLKTLKFLPGALVAVGLSMLLNYWWTSTHSALAIEAGQLVSIPVFSSLSELPALFTLPNWSGFANPAVWKTGLIVAAVASIETLLCIEASDRLDPLKRSTNNNRELKAQGVGNLFSSLIGGLPMTSVVVRSSANVNAGGRRKESTIIHGILLIASVLALPFALNLIPMATLAALLILVGYKLARPVLFTSFWKKGASQFTPFIITFTMVVLSDLLIGVIIGFASSLAFVLFGNLKKAYQFEKNLDTPNGLTYHIQLAEEVSFLNKSAIKDKLESLPNDCRVIIDAKKSVYIHLDIVELIQNHVNEKALEKNIHFDIVGFKKRTRKNNSQEQIILTHRKAI